MLAICLVFAQWVLPLQAAESPRRPSMQSTTSETARREATRAVPLEKMAPQYRRLVQQVITDSSLYRRLPTQMVDCDPELFTFLAQNPEMLVEMWQHMGISRVSLKRTSKNTFSLSDGAGTTGKLVLVEQQCDAQAQNRIVMYCAGAYEGKPFKRPVRAQCVLLLRSGSMKETNSRDYVACRLDSFVRIERTSVELFAKALHPWVGKTADANFTDTIAFISNLSRAAEQKPAMIQRLVNNLPRVTKQRQQALINIAHQCARKYDGQAVPQIARKTK